jgi:hypothetical protein
MRAVTHVPPLAACIARVRGRGTGHVEIVTVCNWWLACRAGVFFGSSFLILVLAHPDEGRRKLVMWATVNALLLSWALTAGSR